MAFDEDLTPFFDTDGHGVDFIHTPAIGADVNAVGIFDSDYASADGGEVGITGSQPQLTFATGDIPSPKYGEIITIAAKKYAIVGIHPDGTGVTTLVLEEQDDLC